MKCVTFARTPIMSTYLLAFVVGEFDYVEERDSNGVLVRVYTPVGKAEQGRFALEVSFDPTIVGSIILLTRPLDSLVVLSCFCTAHI